ncbi:MAG: hypothetical protein ACKVOU_04755 [Cytophagales bacterium]
MARINALNINRLAKYDFKYISIEEILVLEYLLSYFQKNALDIVIANRIELETGIKRAKLNTAIEKLIEKEFISSKVENARTKYTVNFEAITNKLNRIFVKPNVYASQYFLYIQNPAAFKTKAQKAKKTKAVQKMKGKTEEPASQMSLF